MKKKEESMDIQSFANDIVILSLESGNIYNEYSRIVTAPNVNDVVCFREDRTATKLTASNQVTENINC